ncbi:MAG: hypothetical protein IJ693_12050 [Bacteroidaceae bacterium]|nr:hypothetical protein [Bacteroidaceae bacterium]
MIDKPVPIKNKPTPNKKQKLSEQIIVNYRQLSFFQTALAVKEQKILYGSGSCAAAQDKR